MINLSAVAKKMTGLWQDTLNRTWGGASAFSWFQGQFVNSLELTATQNLTQEVVYRMGLDLRGATIEMVAGETQPINLTVLNEQGVALSMVGATAWFAITRVLEKPCIVTGNVLSVVILPAETVREIATEYEFKIMDQAGQVDSLIRGDINISHKIVKVI